MKRVTNNDLIDDDETQRNYAALGAMDGCTVNVRRWVKSGGGDNGGGGRFFLRGEQ